MQTYQKTNVFLLLIIISIIIPLFSYAGEITIEMTDKSYTPKDIEIEIGDTIVFKNIGEEDSWPASNIHPTHQIYSEFDPKRPIPPGESWEFTFDKGGTWKYHDHLYPNITGTITVKDSDGSDSADNGGFMSKITNFFKLIKRFILNLLGIGEDKDSSFIEVSEDSKEIFNNPELLRSYVKKFGPSKTVKRLNELSAEFGSCHDPAHQAGRFSYEIFNEDAFRQCGSECHSGCYHGATEAYFKEHGTANLSKNLNTLCSNELNGFFSHQCIHGIGHGLMAWANYDIFEALKSCDLLDRRQDSCWTGVFMENIVGGLSEEEGHFTKYLSDDPHHPCDIVDEKYKPSCYFLQTSQMIRIFKGDFKKVSDACLESGQLNQYSCFASMGRDVGGANRKNPEGAIRDCSHVPKGEMRNACLGGAIQDTFWDITGQDDALRFCKILTDPGEKNICYNTISGRAVEVLNSKKDRESFCLKAEESFIQNCLTTVNR